MTLNKVKSQLKEIIETHKLVRSFYFGDLSEWTEFTEMAYPSTLFVLNDANFNRPVTTLNLSLYVSDRLEEDNSNRDEVLSDTLQIVQDILADIDNPTNDWLPNVIGAQLTPFEDNRGNDNVDNVAGWKIDFSLGLYTPANRCAIPKGMRKFLITEGGLEIISEDADLVTIEQ
jgi:hypothetical protein